MTMPQGNIRYIYSSTTGNLQTISSPDGVTLNYAHDGSLLTSTSWSGAIQGSVSQIYDHDFRVISQSINGANPVTLLRDSDGLLTQVGDLHIHRDTGAGFISGTTLGSTPMATSQNYNSFGELSGYFATYGGSPLYSSSYTRDAVGRIVQRQETIAGLATTYSYEYDAAGRLQRVLENDALVSEYAYDKNGNRTRYTNGLGASLVGTHDAQDRLISYGDSTYTYTENGDLASKTSGSSTTSYSYDVLGNLKQITLPNGIAIEYIIDGQNRRVGKKVNGTLVQGFIYQNVLKPVAELDGAGQLVSRFVYGTKAHVPDVMIKGGKTYRIISDHLGSVRLVVDVESGDIAQRMDYDEYGVVTQDTSPGFQPFGFAGGLYDHQTSLVRFGARDYDAEMGRWTAKDPIGFRGGDTNVYNYALMDPVNFMDYNGFDVYPMHDNYLNYELALALSEWDETRNKYNMCPMSPPEVGITDCEGRTWEQDSHGKKKYRSDKGDECGYNDDGTVWPGSYNHVPNKYNPLHGLFDYLPWKLRPTSYPQGLTNLYQCNVSEPPTYRCK
jgi:RHS repeat-associated protein